MDLRKSFHCLGFMEGFSQRRRGTGRERGGGKGNSKTLVGEGNSGDRDGEKGFETCCFCLRYI